MNISLIVLQIYCRHVACVCVSSPVAVVWMNSDLECGSIYEAKQSCWRGINITCDDAISGCPSEDLLGYFLRRNHVCLLCWTGIVIFTVALMLLVCCCLCILTQGSAIASTYYLTAWVHIELVAGHRRVQRTADKIDICLMIRLRKMLYW